MARCSATNLRSQNAIDLRHKCSTSNSTASLFRKSIGRYITPRLNQQHRNKKPLKTEYTSRKAFRNLPTILLCVVGLVLAVGAMSNATGQDNARAEHSRSLAQAPGRWIVTGDLVTARLNHTATLLPNGQVLVAGGDDGNDQLTASAELYDPADRTWTATGSLTIGRYRHTATLIPNRQILVVGGFNGIDSLPSAELYNPATGMWIATGNLATARDKHTATLLPNGQVLVAGGFRSGYLTSAELYDPATGMWSATGRLSPGRYGHTATLLRNGSVLASAGYSSDGVIARADLYKSTPQTFDFE